MLKTIKEHLGLLVLFASIAAICIWVQFGVIPSVQKDSMQISGENEPDYYVFNFVSTGMDKSGKLYDLIGERMVHYPLDNKALLDNPHVIKYNDDGSIINLYADSGWLYNNANTIRLTDNVRVVQGESTDLEGGGAATTNKLILQLKDD